MSSLYMQIEALPGESRDSLHQGDSGWTVIQTFSHGLTQVISVDPSASGGRAAGQVQVGEITISKPLDITSPGLNQYCCTAKAIPTIIFEFCRATGEKECYQRYTISNAIVSNVSIAAAQGEDRPSESVSFAFTEIKWEFTRVSQTGEVGDTYEASWNLTKQVVS